MGLWGAGILFIFTLGVPEFESDEQYFLGAMYAPTPRKWYWYDYNRGLRQPNFPYTNWDESYSIEDIEDDYTL